MSVFQMVAIAMLASAIPFGLGYWAGRIDGRRAWAMRQIRREQRQRHSQRSIDYDQGRMDYDRIVRART